MTTLYLVRHGEAMGNILLQFQGNIDCPLTPQGLEQTQCLENDLLKSRWTCCIPVR